MFYTCLTSFSNFPPEIRVISVRHLFHACQISDVLMLSDTCSGASRWLDSPFSLEDVSSLTKQLLHPSIHFPPLVQVTRTIQNQKFSGQIGRWNPPSWTFLHLSWLLSMSEGAALLLRAPSWCPNSRRPVEETYFSLWHPRAHSSGHHPDLTSIGGSLNVDGQEHWELFSSPRSASTASSIPSQTTGSKPAFILRVVHIFGPRDSLGHMGIERVFGVVRVTRMDTLLYSEGTNQMLEKIMTQYWSRQLLKSRTQTALLMLSPVALDFHCQTCLDPLQFLFWLPICEYFSWQNQSKLTIFSADTFIPNEDQSCLCTFPALGIVQCWITINFLCLQFQGVNIDVNTNRSNSIKRRSLHLVCVGNAFCLSPSLL